MGAAALACVLLLAVWSIAHSAPAQTSIVMSRPYKFRSEPVIEDEYQPATAFQRTIVWMDENGASHCSIAWELFCANHEGFEPVKCKARVSGRLEHNCVPVSRAGRLESACEKQDEYSFVSVRAFDPHDAHEVQAVAKE